MKIPLRKGISILLSAAMLLGMNSMPVGASDTGQTEVENNAGTGDKAGQAVVSVNSSLGKTVAGVMPASSDPGIDAYENEAATKDWAAGSNYYYLENGLVKYVFGTSSKFIKNTTLTTPEATGNSSQGSLVPGTLVDAVPTSNKTETLDWTQFVLRSGKVHRTWWYPTDKLSLNNINVNADQSITASGTWERNEGVTASVNYSIVEGTPLLKMDITLVNNTSARQWVNLGYLVDPETQGEQATYVPGSLGWRTSEWTNPDYPATGIEGVWQTPTTGWDKNYLFIGRKADYSGNPTHAIIWSPQNLVYSVIPKYDYTGVWIPATMESGASKKITLYHMTHIPGPTDAPYAVAELWANAVKNGTVDQYKTVTGTVTNSLTGKPIGNARITLTENGTSYSGMTDSRGRYQIYAQKGKTYTVSVRSSSTEDLDMNGFSLYDHMLLEIPVEASVNDTIKLPDCTEAIAESLMEKPGLIYSTPECDTYQTGDILLHNGETTALVDSRNGVLSAVAPNHYLNDSIKNSELVLAETPDKVFGHPGKGFSMNTVKASDHRVVAQGVAQANDKIMSSVTYSMVKNAPLVKVKVSLWNTGVEAYSGSLGYLFDTAGNGEQTYIPGAGWIGGGPGAYGSDLKTPALDQNYLFNGSFGKENANAAHSLLWSKYYVPSKLIFNGDYAGAWYDVSLSGGESKDIVFYHFAHALGNKDNPLVPTQFWADVVKSSTELDSVSQRIGTVSYNGKASTGIQVEAVNGDKSYVTATCPNGSFMLYGIKDRDYSVTVSNGIESVSQTVRLDRGENVNFDLFECSQQSRAGMTYQNPDLIYNPGAGIRDWWPTYPYYYLENELVKIGIDTRRTSTLLSDKPSENSSIYSTKNTGNGVWGGINSGTIVDAASKQNMTENLAWSSFVLFPKRPQATNSADYYDRNYLGVTPQDEAIPNEMYMEWSWWFPVNKLELNRITSDQSSVTAAGEWEGGVSKRKDIQAAVHYSLVDNSPLVKMDIALNNTGSSTFEGQFAYVLDPDMEGEQHSYLPGYGWEYSQVKKRITSGWTDNYVFDGYSGQSSNTAHAIIWPDDQQPMMVFSEAGWISAWFETKIPAGGSDNLTIYYLPHTPGTAEAPYSVAEYWSRFVKENRSEADQAVITGKVTDRSGKLLEGARVSLSNKTGFAAETVTDFTGCYTLFAQAGSYSLSIAYDGYATYEEDLALTGGNKVNKGVSLIKYADVTVNLPNTINRGEAFTFEVQVTNESGNQIESMNVEISAPAGIKMLAGENTVLSQLEAGETRSITASALAYLGGRENIFVRLSGPQFDVKMPFVTDIAGFGWYSGDNHTHSQFSDGSSTIAENADGAYRKWNRSWIWNTDHNTDAQKGESDTTTASYNGKFISLSATEITTGYTHKPTTPSGVKRGHALVYGFNGIPRLIIDPKGGAYDWQASINEIIAANGLYYLAHPFDVSYPFEDAYDWTGYTGIEVWNGGVHASHPSSQAAFKLWDQVNIRGEKHYLGIAGTDSHNAQKVGDLGVKGILPSLSGGDVLDLLRNGAFYGTNGPELRFNVNGGDMGSTVMLSEQGKVTIELEAFSEHGNLTSVKVLGYPITGDMNNYDAAAAVIFEKDLTSLETNWYCTSLETLAQTDMFYRLEVKSEKSIPGSTENGPEVGTGFAFSNPVWVKMGDESTSRNIESIKYGGQEVTVRQDGFGRKVLTVAAAEFLPERLTVQAGNAVTSMAFSPISYNSKVLGVLDIKVISGGFTTQYSFIIENGT